MVFVQTKDPAVAVKPQVPARGLWNLTHRFDDDYPEGSYTTSLDTTARCSHTRCQRFA